MESLPSEILISVFEWAVCPSNLIDPALTHFEGEDSPWIRRIYTILGLTRVCLAWYRSSIHILYHHILIHRIGQLSALLRTLRGGPDTFASYVQKLTIHCYIPEGYGDVFDKSAKSVIELCTNLHHYVRLIPSAEELSIHLPSDIFLAPLVNLVAAKFLTHLDMPVQQFRKLIEQSGVKVALDEKLKSLTLRYFNDFRGSPQGIRLSSIRNLEFRGGSDPWNGALNWYLPSLEALSWRDPLSWSRNSLHAFLQRHGRGLSYLHLCRSLNLSSLDPATPLTLLDLAVNTPRLEHLSIPLPASDSSPVSNSNHLLQISHPTIRWVDVWGCIGLAEDDERVRNTACLLRELSNLSKLRLVDKALLNISDINRLIPPDAPASYVYEGVDIRNDEQKGTLYRADMLYLDSDADNQSSSDSDADYQSPSEDASSESGSDSNSDSESEAGLDQEDWEANEDEVLERYLANRL